MKKEDKKNKLKKINSAMDSIFLKLGSDVYNDTTNLYNNLADTRAKKKTHLNKYIIDNSKVMSDVMIKNQILQNDHDYNELLQKLYQIQISNAKIINDNRNTINMLKINKDNANYLKVYEKKLSSDENKFKKITNKIMMYSALLEDYAEKKRQVLNKKSS